MANTRNGGKGLNMNHSSFQGSQNIVNRQKNSNVFGGENNHNIAKLIKYVHKSKSNQKLKHPVRLYAELMEQYQIIPVIILFWSIVEYRYNIDEEIMRYNQAHNKLEHKDIFKQQMAAIVKGKCEIKWKLLHRIAAIIKDTMETDQDFYKEATNLQRVSSEDLIEISLSEKEKAKLKFMFESNKYKNGEIVVCEYKTLGEFGYWPCVVKMNKILTVVVYFIGWEDIDYETERGKLRKWDPNIVQNMKFATEWMPKFNEAVQMANKLYNEHKDTDMDEESDEDEESDGLGENSDTPMDIDFDNCTNTNNTNTNNTNTNNTNNKNNSMYLKPFKDWLEKYVGLPEYFESFRKVNHAHTKMIEYFDEETLKHEIGIEKPIHRKLIAEEAKEFKKEQTLFDNFFKQSNELVGYKSVLHMNGVLRRCELRNIAKNKQDLVAIFGQDANEKIIDLIWNSLKL